MQFDNSMTFVRSLKGAPISILVAFMICRRAMTALELQQWTGYKGDNITAAVRLLEVEGWISARSPRGPWCLCDGRQLPLMELEDLKVDSITRADSDLIGFMPSSSSSSNSKLNLPSNLEEQEEQDDSDLIGVVAALDAAGIREPKRSQLANLKHVTVELINAHLRQCKAEGLELGTAIYRIQYNWAAAERYMAVHDASLDNYYGKLFALRNQESDDEE